MCNNNKESYLLRVPPGTLDRLKKLSDKEGMPLAWLVRRALDREMKRLGDKQGCGIKS